MPEDVHPQIQALLDGAAEVGIPKIQMLSTGGARTLIENLTIARNQDYPPPEVLEVRNMSTGAGYSHVPVRLYRTSSETPAPVIVFFHGGGHVFGSLDDYDTVARFLALATGCTLVSVDYRMGPEYPFPAAVEDAYDATRWVADHAETLNIDPSRLAICGDSAGGNLAAVVALMARDSAALSISAQVLVYPVIDYRGGTPTYERYGEGYGILEADTVTWFRDRYLPIPEQWTDWRAAPRLATSHAGLPPALVLTAECDVLRNEGQAYANQLKAADVLVDQIEFKGMVHGFFSYLGLVDDADRAHQICAKFLRQIWSSSTH